MTDEWGETAGAESGVMPRVLPDQEQNRNAGYRRKPPGRLIPDTYCHLHRAERDGRNTAADCDTERVEIEEIR